MINLVTLTDYTPPAFSPERMGMLNDKTLEYTILPEYIFRINKTIVYTEETRKFVLVEFIDDAPISPIRDMLAKEYLKAGWRKITWSKKGTKLKLYK